MWTRTLRTTTTRRMRRRALSPLTTPQDHQQVLLLILQLRKHTILSGFVKELSQESSQLSLWWGQSLSYFITNDQLYDTLLSRNILNGIPDEAKPELKLHSSPQTAICFSHQVKSKDITSSLILIWEVETENTLTVFKSFLKKSSFKVRPSSQPAPSRTFPLSLLAQVHIIEG